MIKYLKKLSVLSIIVLTCTLFGCFEPDPNDISNEYYEMAIVDAENKKIAVGDIKFKSNDEEPVIFFVPYTIDGYTVSMIGVKRRVIGSYISLSNSFIYSRLYFPSTIEGITNMLDGIYMSNYECKTFFCNKPMDLLRFNSNAYNKGHYYVPSEYYDGYVELNVRDPDIVRSLYKANVCYYYNLEESDYYYVDYYDVDSLIEFIPPDPVNEGYIFGGWYKEKECINKWDFEKDTVSLEEDEIEIKLYAKWIKE